MTTTSYKKKLIEVAMPLEAINKASVREKSIHVGHPSTLHLYWARRPLATCRAVLFAQLVDDPSAHPDKFPTEAEQTAERERLFRIIEELVIWENSTNEEVLKNFDLLLKAKYEESELAQVNPKRLAESFNFAQKLVFPSSSKPGRHESYLLFLEGGCHLIFRQESWSKSEIKFELDKLITAARLFSVM